LVPHLCPNRAEGIYAPGYARDHRYRVPAIPESFDGLSVLDIGTFDGSTHPRGGKGGGAGGAVDNEQYIDWAGIAGTSTWKVARVSARSTACSTRGVEYRKLDALELDVLGESFDFIFCCGSCTASRPPGRLLEVLSRRLSEGGRVLIETHGVFEDPDDGDPFHRYARVEVYPDDDYVLGVHRRRMEKLARRSGFTRFECIDAPVIDGHPRLIGCCAAEAGEFTARSHRELQADYIVDGAAAANSAIASDAAPHRAPARPSLRSILR